MGSGIPTLGRHRPTSDCECALLSEPHFLEILNTEEGDPPWCDDWKHWCAWDDVEGGELPARDVYLARKRELEYLAARKVYEYASTSMAIQRTGKRPLRLKWIDVNKGDQNRFNIRSRLVCTEVRPKGVEAIFAAAPPLETLRSLMVLLSQEDPSNSASPLTLTLADVSRAHFYAKATREVYIQLPPEDPKAGVRDTCGRLLKTMYGTLDAAQKWAEHYACILSKAGFIQGAASPCHFHHPGWGST